MWETRAEIIGTKKSLLLHIKAMNAKTAWQGSTLVPASERRNRMWTVLGWAMTNQHARELALEAGYLGDCGLTHVGLPL